MSAAARDLLKSLPGYRTGRPDDLVFPNSEDGPQLNWDRATNLIQEASGTSDWHRHDLRPTGSTLLKELGIPPHLVDEILAHKNPFTRSNVSASAVNYMIAVSAMTTIPNLKAEALDQLAIALELIAKHAMDESSVDEWLCGSVEGHLLDDMIVRAATSAD